MTFQCMCGLESLFTPCTVSYQVNTVKRRVRSFRLPLLRLRRNSGFGRRCRSVMGVAKVLHAGGRCVVKEHTQTPIV